MSPTLRFDGKVAVITGAGGGLGRAYALAYAKLGAKVVVNDLGGSTRGEGASNSAADKVVDEIKAGGGEAIANYDSVTEGDKIIAAAVQKFGRVDILINNAGILRDVSFAKMKDEDWKLLNDVHLNGTYKTTKAAWEHMQKNKFGRIVMVTSAAGLYGSHGQSHYSAVKMGILGFANTLQMEGKSKNIQVNTIAPIAGSRMTATVMPEELLNALKPEYVVPLVLYLTAESTTETGGLFEVGAGYISKVRWQRTAGVSFPTGNGITPEQVAQKWSQIIDYSNNPEYPTSSRDAFTHIMANIGNTGSAADVIKPQAPAKQASSGGGGGGKSKVNVELAKQHQFPSMEFSYTERDVILYALGIGAGADVAADKSELRWVYENSDNFQVFPTFGVIPPSEALGGLVGAKGLEFNPMQLLHGEQKLHVLKPLPTSGKLTSHAKISDIWDKGSGAAVIMDVTTKNEQGEDVLRNTYTVFIRGLGGFSGNKGPASTSFAPPPSIPPTVVHREQTLPNQAVLYRLSGDLNPLHIDPDMAAMGNFPKPILHGLCSFGYATRAVIKHFADNDASKFQSIHARFVKPVFPGETLVTSMWQVDPQHITFRVRAAERGEQVLIGQVTLQGDASSTAAASTASSSLPSGTGFASEEVFKQLQQMLSPDIVQKVKATYRFDLTKGGKTLYWLLDLKNGGGSISGADATTKADVSLAMSDDDFIGLMSGKSDAQKMFMSGKIKFKGNIMLAQKLQLLKPSGNSKL